MFTRLAARSIRPARFAVRELCIARGELSDEAKRAIETLGAQLDDTQVELMSERCIEVDAKDDVVGPISKVDAHLWDAKTDQCPAHRAFSVFLFDDEGQLLIQQRSSDKILFPMHWANTCCSHPWHTEEELEVADSLGVKRAAQRKLQHELGILPEEVPLDEFKFLTRIHYKARCDERWGEHEIDHILLIQPSSPITLRPSANEVAQARFVSPNDLATLLDTEQSDNSAQVVAAAAEAVASGERSLEGQLVSPWFRLISRTLLPRWWRAVQRGKMDSLESDNEIHLLGWEEQEGEGDSN